MITPTFSELKVLKAEVRNFEEAEAVLTMLLLVLFHVPLYDIHYAIS
jgi:hypothetical protein